MEKIKITEALRNTTNPEKREEAEKYLDQVHKIIGFVPCLLEVVMSDDIEGPVRQAGVIYMKNTVTKYWEEHADDSNGVVVFTIHEQDRHWIREHIVEAIIHSPEAIRVQLAVCVTLMLKNDFPGKWPQVVDKISQYLQQADGQSWNGALTVLYRLAKIYEYRRSKEKEPLIQTMKVLLPMLYERMLALMPNETQESVFLQKLIVKIYYALVQFSLNFEMMTKEEFVKWMELMRQIVERPVPVDTLQVAEDERPELVWWKCKKWASHLMERVFERYGNPGQVEKQYNKFADYYLKNHAAPSIETMLKVLHNYRSGDYMAPRVLHNSIHYLQHGVSHAFSWKFIKPNMKEIISDVIFPLMRHSDQDEEMWDEDPQEYIKFKYDVYDELYNPQSAASGFLSAAMKRQKQLPEAIGFIVGVLNRSEADDRDIDGALHMVGTIAPTLLKKKPYKTELENMLVHHVYPRMALDKERFLRARSCWCLQNFSEAKFQQESNLSNGINLLVNSVLNDTELPVKVEAALAIQMLLSDQERVKKMLKNHIHPLLLAVLKLISETENEDLTQVMEKLIREYMEDVVPIAVDVAQGLANVFAQFLQSEESSEDRSLTAMGILNTLESVLTVMEEHKEIMVHLENIVLGVIEVVIEHSVMDFYEEVLSLVHSLTCSGVSEPMWKVYNTIFDMFTREGIDYFTDMMPALHNFVTVDTDGFLSQPDRLRILLDMCRQVMTEDTGEDAQAHAAKLLEVVILQCKGRIDAYIRPISELVLSRLTSEVKTSELRTMCLQVIVAGLLYNAPLMLETLQALQPPDSNQSIIDHFVKQWIGDTDCFFGIHDRKVCVLGFSTLLSLPGRPNVMAHPDIVNQVMPNCLMLFDGLQKAYQEQADAKLADSSDGDSDEDFDKDDGLASDEDDVVDELTLEYLERLNKNEGDSGNCDGSSSDSDDNDYMEETDLECYETPLDGDEPEMDEFLYFKQTLIHLQQTEPQFYCSLVGGLSSEQQQKLQKLMEVADKRQQLADSKKIQRDGGYQFANEQVPMNFDFGGPQI